MRRLVGVLAVALAVAACNDDGRTLRAAPPPTAPPVETPIFTDDAATLSISSSVVGADGTIDAGVTCDGDGAFPPLTVSGVDPTMIELAVIVVDESAGEHVHWVAAGIPPSTTTIDVAAGLPEAAVVGTTTGGVTGWEPLCPPPGDAAHRYRFSLYAYAEPIGMEPGLPASDALDVLPRAAVGYAELVGYFGR